MKKLYSTAYYFTLAVILLLFGFSKKPMIGNINSGFIYPLDTLPFVPDSTTGWHMYATYMNQDTPDSVRFEVILRHVALGGWKSDHYIGQISQSNFFPKKNQVSTYYLLRDRWKIKVNKSGEVYIKLDSGSAPPGYPVVLPINTRFKNSN
jgi:hypothetical protein